MKAPQTLYVQYINEDRDSPWFNAQENLDDFDHAGELLIYKLVEKGEVENITQYKTRKKFK